LTAIAIWCVPITLVGLLGWTFVASPWPVGLTTKHIIAARNCDAARSVGLAPARRGEPGYWARNDRDKDGIACEHYFQWAQQRTSQ
jgi:hypothetical protein